MNLLKIDYFKFDIDYLVAIALC